MRNVIFSKDTEKLYNIRNELLETLEPVDISIPIGEISQEFLVRLNEAVGIAITADSTDPKMKLSLQEFMSVNYSSPSVPSGRMALRDDYMFIWFLKQRIQGKGKRKSPKTVSQYATYLFGNSQENLYKHLEAKNIRLEDSLFPTGLRVTMEIEAWGTTENPSSTSKFFFFLNLITNSLATIKTQQFYS